MRPGTIEGPILIVFSLFLIRNTIRRLKKKSTSYERSNLLQQIDGPIWLYGELLAYFGLLVGGLMMLITGTGL